MTDLYRFDLNELDLTVDAPGRSEGLPLAI